MGSQCLRAFCSSLTKHGSSYNLCSSALKNRAVGKSSKGKENGVDLGVLGEGEHKGSLKAEVFYICSVGGSSVPTA